MADEKKVLIDVEIKSGDAVKNIAALKGQVADLKKEQDGLTKSGQSNSEQFVSNAEKIKALNTVIREQSKEVQNNIKAQNEQDGSLQSLKANLGLLTAEYNKLSKEQRNGAAGVELKNSIKGISDELKNAEGGVGNFTRNVGDYENKIKSALGLNGKFTGTLTEMASGTEGLSAGFKGAMTSVTEMASGTEGLSAGFKGAMTSVKAFGTQLLTLLANPVVLIISGIAAAVALLVGVFKKAYDVIQGNEEQSNKLNAALAALKPIGDAVTRIFESLGEVLITVAEGFGKVVGWMSDLIGAGEEVNATTQTYIDLEKEKAQLLIDNRKNNEAASKTELEIAQLRNKIAEKDKYDAKQRIEFVDQAIAKELELGENKRILAERNLARLKIEDPLTKNSIAFQNELSAAIIAVNNATADAITSTKRLVASRATAVEEIRNENKAAEAKGIADAKAAADKRLEIATKLRQAENQLLNLKKETELNALNEIFANAKKSDSERLTALIQLEDEKKSLLQTNAAFQLSNNKLTNAERFVIEQKLSNDLVALDLGTKKQIETLDTAANTKRLNEQIAALTFETEFAKSKLDEQLAGKIRTDEQIHLATLLQIENDRKAKEDEFNLRLKAEPEKEAEIKRAIQLLNQKAQATTAKEDADFTKKQSELKLQAAKLDLNNELELAKGNINKEHELLLKQLKLDQAAEIAAAEKTGADVDLINQKYAQRERELNEETAKLKVENALKTAQAVGDAMSGVNDFLNALGEREVADYEKKNKEKKAKLDEQLKAGLISQQEHDYQVAVSAYELDKKKDKLEREAAIRAKALAIVMAAINTASAIVAALATPLVGPVLAIAAGIAGAAQIAAIIATPLPGGSAGAIPNYNDFAPKDGGATGSTGSTGSNNTQKDLEKSADTAQKLADKAEAEYQKAIEKADKAIQEAADLKAKIAQEEKDRADKQIMDAWEKSDKAIAEASKRADDISTQAQKSLSDAVKNLSDAQKESDNIQSQIDRRAQDRITAADKAIMDAWEKSDKAIAEASKRADDISKQAQAALSTALTNFEKAQNAVLSIQAKIDKRAADKLTAEESARVKLLEAAEKNAIDAGNKATQEADRAAELASRKELEYQALLGGAVNYGSSWYRPDLKAAQRKQDEKIENARIEAEAARLAAETTKAVQESANIAAKQATLAAEERAKAAAEALKRAAEAEDLALLKELEAAKQAEIDAKNAAKQAELVAIDANLAQQAATEAAKQAALAAEERAKVAAEIAKAISDAEDLRLKQQLEAAKIAIEEQKKLVEIAQKNADNAKIESERQLAVKLAAEAAAEERKRSYDEEQEEKRRIANETAQAKADKTAMEAQEAANNARLAATQAAEALALALSLLTGVAVSNIPDPLSGKNLNFDSNALFKNDGGYQGRATDNKGGISKQDIRDAMMDAVSGVRVYTTVEDIRKADKNYSEVIERATY